jgi:glycosyltransferase involved in cell wall biosynthesis
MTGASRPGLLVAKGSFGSMGGAERDLIRVLPAINCLFEVTMATIQPSTELEETCSENDIELIRPESEWHLSTDPISVVLDSGRGTASKAWASCNGLSEAMESSMALHLVSGDGSLPILDHVPAGLRVHLHLLEPHRGLYEETLHRRVDGSPRRNLALTKAALSRARSRDQSLMESLISRQDAIVSGNSRFSAQRANEVYGVEAGVLWPCVDTNEFPEDRSDDPENPYPEEGDYVVSVGRASYAKGTWETISMLAGTGLSLAHVGGGDEGSLGMLRKHAYSSGVGLWVAPRLPSPDLVSLMRGARAIVSMAHKESFGLTPIEAFAVGTPPLFVDEGGFRDTIVDGENGRLLDRGDVESWHSALEQASDPGTREGWAARGRERISELDLAPEAHARRIWDLLC